ncbi:MAG: hypothetical protein J7496_08530 [Novosphingobium sp.]|nr:hypothetical protein [Novosphingobium sp.]
MKIIDPETIDDTALDATNVAETLAAYNPATGYTQGQQVRVDSTHHAYESVLAGTNTGNDPTTDDGTKWLDLGSTNPWAMFDEYLESQTSNADTIAVTLVPAGIADAMAFFNLDAATISITVTDATDGVVYDEDFDLISDVNCGDYYDYCFQPIIRKTALFVDGLPPYVGPDIDVVIDNTGSTAKCGALLMGSLRTLGATVYGADFGIIDSSRKTTDDFGRTTIVPRSYRKTGNFRVIVDKDYVGEVDRILSERRAVFSVFSGTDEYESALIYGFPRDWRVTLDYPEQSTLNIEIEGVV